ncbi:MAG: ATP-binding cassette domain-containing protein [bacterium]|nr:ATP-binding cassette domain-containing protein [bacterium]
MLEFKNISFSYGQGTNLVRPVFSGLDLEVSQGEHLLIMGGNGSGKSTLAALIKGLLTPQEGKIFYFGKDVTRDGINHRIGYLFSNPENQIVSPVVEDDVAFGPENYGATNKEIVYAVQQSLLRTNSEHLRKELTHQLSGGQQQRVNIAGIFALDLDCIILDEAASMLDPSSRRELLNLISKMHGGKKLSIIQLTHCFEEIFLADRLIVLSKGEVVFNGSPQNLIQDESALDLLGANDDKMINLLRRLIKEEIVQAGHVKHIERLAAAIAAFKKDACLARH